MSTVYADNAGINLGENGECLTNGSCSLDIYETLGIREEVDENTTELFVQDVVLGATFFIGTLAAVGLIVSGFKMVMAGGNESAMEKGRKGFIYSLIGLLLVVFSYTLIRLVQYIAQGGQ